METEELEFSKIEYSTSGSILYFVYKIIDPVTNTIIGEEKSLAQLYDMNTHYSSFNLATGNFIRVKKSAQ